MCEKRIGMAVVLLLLCSVGASAQSTGSISGVIVDASGGVIPGADVTVTNTQTGVAIRTVTQGDGTYLFGSLQTGTYVTTAELSGVREPE